MTMLYKMVSIPSCASLSETLTQDLYECNPIRLETADQSLSKLLHENQLYQAIDTPLFYSR